MQRRLERKNDAEAGLRVFSDDRLAAANGHGLRMLALALALRVARSMLYWRGAIAASSD